MNGLRIAIVVVLLVLAVALAAQAAPLRTLVVAPESNGQNTCRAAAASVKVTR